MSNPRPSLFQALVLHYVNDGEVRFEGELFDSGKWVMWIKDLGRDRRVVVTRQIEKMIDAGYVRVIVEFPGLKVVPTSEGHEVIKRRPLHELLEQMNRRNT